MDSTLKWHEQEVTHPLVKVLVPLILIALALATLPVALPLHVILRRAGRRGFMVWTSSNEFTWDLSPQAFARVR